VPSRPGTTTETTRRPQKAARNGLDEPISFTNVLSMQIEVRTGNHIQGDERLNERVIEWTEHALSNFSRRITRVEVHISDENGVKETPGDTKCVMEARVEKRQPTAVTEFADNVELAVRGAAAKLARALEREIGRLEAR